MKRSYSLLFIVACLLIGLNASAQAPQAGKKYQIIHGNSYLYLTADAGWGSTGSLFIDSLYTSTFSGEIEIPFEDTERTDNIVSVNYSPEQQIFTLVNPDPNDPEIYAIEAYDGQYITQNSEYTWDCTLGGNADAPTANWFISDDEGYGLFQIRLSTRTAQYIAPDNETEGFKINKWDDGWEYVSRSFVYNDKPSSAKSYWVFEEVAETSIKSLTVNKNLTVSPTIAKETLKVNVENGVRISIYSVTGAKVLDTVVNGNVNISSLTSGVYLVATLDGKKAKFIKK
jgi:hypothetical protein